MYDNIRQILYRLIGGGGVIYVDILVSSEPQAYKRTSIKINIKDALDKHFLKAGRPSAQAIPCPTSNHPLEM